jgi:enoyl-CoA hydratase/carnithine racemase
MSAFDDYSQRFRTVRMERRDGILLMTLHTEGKALRWGLLPHEELPVAFWEVGRDRENKVVILTGTGDEFSGPRPTPDTGAFPARPTALAWDKVYWEGKQLLTNLLNIEVPMISAVNGPAMRHSELALLCDVVLAAEEASFQDSGHFVGGLVPGDGVHVMYPLLLGVNRGRYFLLTGQTISAREAQTLGLVAEVLPRDRLLERAWALAEDLVKQPTLHLRYTRVLFTEYLKRQMQGLLGYGLALEGMALMERPLPPPTAG